MCRLKKILKSVLSENTIDKLVFWKNHYLDGYSLKSYSQEGEDLILNRIFEAKKEGFYVDVGALSSF